MTAIRGTVLQEQGLRQNASHEIEKLAIQAKEIVTLLRDKAGCEMSYALVYELRTRLGRVVSSLGVGLPDGAAHSAASEILDMVVE